MYYGSNLYRKDNPRWRISNAAEIYRVIHPTRRVGDHVRSAAGTCVSWVIGLPRRAGARLYAANDAEARWWGWQVTERYGGLVRQYRDPRFAALPGNPSLRRDELREDLARRGTAAAQRPDCPRCGDL